MDNILKDLRLSRNLTRKELADKFGLTVSAISNYELDIRVPTDDIKKKYSVFFDKSVDEIFFTK